MSGVDVPLTDLLHLERAIALYYSTLTPNDRQKYRNQIIDVTAEDIKALAPLIKDVIGDNYFCVVGSENKIEAHKDIFGAIKKV